MKEIRLPYGTFIDMAALLAGGLVGLLLKDNFPENINTIIYRGIGLPILLVGLMMSFKLPDGYVLILVLSMVLGGIIGELVHLDLFFENLGENLKSLIHVQDETFTEGLISAFLLCCIGSMTIVGCIEEGINGNRELLMIKSLLDVLSGILLATSFGVGVIFAIIPMLIYQGSITLLAGSAQSFFFRRI